MKGRKNRAGHVHAPRFRDSEDSATGFESAQRPLLTVRASASRPNKGDPTGAYWTYTQAMPCRTISAFASMPSQMTVNDFFGLVCVWHIWIHSNENTPIGLSFGMMRSRTAP